MSTDLEQRLHDELRVRAGDAGPARTAGGTVRQVAAARRTRRLRAGAVAGSAVLAAAVVVGVVTVARDGRPEELPPAQPTLSPTSSPTTSDRRAGPGDGVAGRAGPGLRADGCRSSGAAGRDRAARLRRRRPGVHGCHAAGPADRGAHRHGARRSAASRHGHLLPAVGPPDRSARPRRHRHDARRRRPRNLRRRHGRGDDQPARQGHPGAIGAARRPAGDGPAALAAVGHAAAAPAAWQSGRGPHPWGLLPRGIPAPATGPGGGGDDRRRPGGAGAHRRDHGLPDDGGRSRVAGRGAAAVEPDRRRLRQDRPGGPAAAHRGRTGATAASPGSPLRAPTSCGCTGATATSPMSPSRSTRCRRSSTPPTTGPTGWCSPRLSTAAGP